MLNSKSEGLPNLAYCKATVGIIIYPPPGCQCLPGRFCCLLPYIFRLTTPWYIQKPNFSRLAQNYAKLSPACANTSSSTPCLSTTPQRLPPLLPGQPPPFRPHPPPPPMPCCTPSRRPSACSSPASLRRPATWTPSLRLRT